MTSDTATMRRDRGATFIELLVSIVLLGTVVVSVLVALRASVAASTIDSEHARAYVLLHEASDAVYLEPRVSCLSPATEASIIAAYSTSLASLTKPEGWASVTPVITKIEFLNASDASGSTVYTWGPDCFEGPVDADGSGTIDLDEDFTELPLKSQKVTIEVTNPAGGFTKVIETVKR